MLNKIVRTKDGNIWFIRQVNGNVLRLQNGIYSKFIKNEECEIINHIDNFSRATAV